MVWFDLLRKRWGLDVDVVGWAEGVLSCGRLLGSSVVSHCQRFLTVRVQISLGDQSNYYLTTAKNELGVIMAKSEAGNTMVPISWREFKDPVTGLTESRKVAKPF